MAIRKGKIHRRNLNIEEMFAMGFTQMRETADEQGWPYPDDDDEETTENSGQADDIDYGPGPLLD